MPDKPWSHPYFRNRAAWMMPRTILIVDPDTSFSRRMESALQEIGAKVITVASGAAALCLIREHRPGVVILDLTLSDVDAFEVFREIREDLDLCNTVVIVSHPKPTDTDVHRAFQLASDCFLVKPIDPLEVQPFISRLFAHFPE